MDICHRNKQFIFKFIVYTFVVFSVGFFVHDVTSKMVSDTYICNAYQDVDSSSGGIITGYTHRVRCYVIGVGGYKEDSFCSKSESTSNGVDFINSVCSGYGKFTFNINNKGPSRK